MTSPIVVENVSKRFRIYGDRANSLKEGVTRGAFTRFDEYWALRDVSLDIPSGSMFGLIGHNGSGKSTLLRIIAGIYRPTSGVVRTTGRISALLELGSGFHPDLTGRENIYLNASILGMTPKEIERSLDEIIEFAGINDFIDAPIKVYSSGMYVRLGFAVAVHVNPEILIIDEVIAVGDEEFQRRCFDFLYSLREKGVTIVVVSHSLDLMRTMCDRAAWLDHGTLQVEGASSDVVAAYLSDVNEREHRRALDQGDETADQHDRVGTGEIRITRIEFLDGNGNPTVNGTYGEPLTIRLRYRADHAVVNPIFGMTIFHQNGMLVTGTSTHLDQLPTGVCEGDGAVDYILDPLWLTPGRYRIGIAIQDEHIQHHFDRSESVGALTVRIGDGPASRGTINLAGRWNIDR